jgi:hypothetical protein
MMRLLRSLTPTHLPLVVGVPLFGMEFLLGLFVIPIAMACHFVGPVGNGRTVRNSHRVGLPSSVPLGMTTCCHCHGEPTALPPMFIQDGAHTCRSCNRSLRAWCGDDIQGEGHGSTAICCGCSSTTPSPAARRSVPLPTALCHLVYALTSIPSGKGYFIGYS